MVLGQVLLYILNSSFQILSSTASDYQHRDIRFCLHDEKCVQTLENGWRCTNFTALCTIGEVVCFKRLTCCTLLRTIGGRLLVLDIFIELLLCRKIILKILKLIFDLYELISLIPILFFQVVTLPVGSIKFHQIRCAQQLQQEASRTADFTRICDYRACGQCSSSTCECWLHWVVVRLSGRNGLNDSVPQSTQRWRGTHLWHAHLERFARAPRGVNIALRALRQSAVR